MTLDDHAQEFPGSHTAAAISGAFENMLEQWHLTKENVHVVIRDNARNMAKAMGESGVASLGCVAHTLQLIVNEGVFSQRSISDCVAIGIKIVGYFKHANVATCRVKEMQTQLGMKTNMLKQDVSTCWNSTFSMLQSLIEQKWAIAAYGVDQWTLMENHLNS